MTARITAAARTPWARRHGALEGVRPEHLLATAMSAVVEQASVPADRVLVGCDEAVGAQHQNIARRTCLDLGWESTPALTVDGQGMTGLGLVSLAATLPGATLIAAVDSTTLIPPGAGLVRDYGRPTHDHTPTMQLEQAAIRAGLTRSILDEVATALRASTAPLDGFGIIEVTVGRETVRGDQPDDRTNDDLPPLATDGIQTAFHEAEYADGAAAVLVMGPGAPSGRHDAGHVLESATIVAYDPRTDLTGHLGPVGRGSQPLLLASPNAVTATTVGIERQTATLHQVRPVLSSGTTPSADGLRLLVDAIHRLDGAVVVDPGRFGQTAIVEISAD